jgi:hypothetical protein
MKPVAFPEQNCVFAENQDEYMSLPSFSDPNDEQGTVISCWKFTCWERLKLLFTGRLWVLSLTFGAPLQPIAFDIDYPSMPKPLEESN